MMQGEAVTWQKLSAIQAACDIELTFDRCLAMVKAAEAQVHSWTCVEMCSSCWSHVRVMVAMSSQLRLSTRPLAVQQQNIFKVLPPTMRAGADREQRQRAPAPPGKHALPHPLLVLHGHRR